jgi:hypothetical protein
MHTTRGQTA